MTALDLDPFLHTLPNSLEPLVATVKRHMPSGVFVAPDGWFIASRPRIAPEAFGIRVWRPLASSSLSGLLDRHEVRLPGWYMGLLGSVNGFYVFEFSLFGIVIEQDRSRPQPFDAVQANTSLRGAFRAPSGWSMIGSSPFDDDNNVGYFADDDGQVIGLLKGGKRIGEWSSLSGLLAEELPRAERAFPEYESFMEGLRGSQ